MYVCVYILCGSSRAVFDSAERNAPHERASGKKKSQKISAPLEKQKKTDRLQGNRPFRLLVRIRFSPLRTTHAYTHIARCLTVPSAERNLPPFSKLAPREAYPHSFRALQTESSSPDLSLLDSTHTHTRKKIALRAALIIFEPGTPIDQGVFFPPMKTKFLRFCF